MTAYTEVNERGGRLCPRYNLIPNSMIKPLKI